MRVSWLESYRGFYIHRMKQKKNTHTNRKKERKEETINVCVVSDEKFRVLYSKFCEIALTIFIESVVEKY